MDNELEPGMVEVHHEDGRVEQIPGELLSVEITDEMRERQALLEMAAERTRRRVIEFFGGYVEPPTLTADAIAAAVREALSTGSSRDDWGLVDEDALAALLGVSAPTLATWRSRRQGPPFVRAGKTILYRRPDVERWMEDQRVDTEQDVQPSDGRRRRR